MPSRPPTDASRSCTVISIGLLMRTTTSAPPRRTRFAAGDQLASRTFSTPVRCPRGRAGCNRRRACAPFQQSAPRSPARRAANARPGDWVSCDRDSVSENLGVVELAQQLLLGRPVLGDRPAHPGRVHVVLDADVLADDVAPHVPQPRLAVIGIPLVNEPALPLTFGCRTMMRLTGALTPADECARRQTTRSRRMTLAADSKCRPPFAGRCRSRCT